MSSSLVASSLDLETIVEHCSSFITTEYASLTRDGRPITWPVTPYRGLEGRTLDVATGLTYPLKAERARRNPKVTLSFTNPTGSRLTAPGSVVVHGLATVRDADLVGASSRYLQSAADRFPASFKSIPTPMLRNMAWYWARMWVEVTPVRVLWWDHGDLSRAPQVWEAPDGTVAPPSDPAPAGRGPGSHLAGGPDWRRRVEGAIERLGEPVLTTVTADGWPLNVKTRAARAVDDGFVVVPPTGVDVASGPAFLSFHTHAEVFDGQENIGLAGTATVEGDEVHFRVDRALSDFGVPRNKVRSMLTMLRARRRLHPRLATEAARRGQPIPTFEQLAFRRP